MKSQPGYVTLRARKTTLRKTAEKENNALLELVRDGVRRFIVKDAPIGDFQKAIRAAARKGEGSSHPLSGLVFRKIVKEAIRERKRRTRKATL